MNNAGSLPDYEGDDYGLYQIYGKHILCEINGTLFYEVIKRVQNFKIF